MSDNSDPHKMSILYILHAYFVRASSDSKIIIEILSPSWTDTMEKVINYYRSYRSPKRLCISLRSSIACARQS